MLDVRRVLEHNAVCLLLPAIYYYIIIYFEKQLLKPKQEVYQKSKKAPPMTDFKGLKQILTFDLFKIPMKNVG